MLLALVLIGLLMLRGTEPSAASVPTDSPRVFAAVSDNGVTVTGLLRYEPRSDGGWFCAGQGVEPIETPADLDALAGLSMEELTERLGPCHFDLGSGLYLPCWFTEDCRMLVVHTQSSAELRELSAPAD